MGSLALERFEQLAAFGFAGLQAFGVLSSHEQTGDEASEETEGDGDEVEHGDYFVINSTLTRGPRSAGVCGLSKVT